MYIVLQRFKIRLGSMDAAGQLASEELIPRIKQLPGFLSFHLVDAGERTVASVGLFESQQSADEATRLCQAWFRSDWPSFLAVPPELTRGAVLAGAIASRPAASAEPLAFPQIERRRGVERRWGNERRGQAQPVLVSATGS